MRQYLYLLFQLTTHLTYSQQDTCTVSGLPWAGCQFPYLIKDKIHTECTNIGAEEEARCPIRLDNFQTSNNQSDWAVCHKTCPLGVYKSNQEIYDGIIALSKDYPSITLPFVIGESVNGQSLVGIRVSKGIRNGPRETLKPMVRIVGNIHGNEAVSREVVFNLARHLVMAYGLDPKITQLVDTTDISLLPSINPDGFSVASLGTCNGIGKKAGMFNQEDKDLNLDFPTLEDFNQFRSDYNYDPYVGRQPETMAMMQWTADNPFVLSGSLHDGATLVTYPFDHQNEVGEENLTPDQDLFHHLATTYTRSHPTMYSGTKCFRKANKEGATNGAKWHKSVTGGPLSGSMQDFSYMFSNTLEMSIHMSCCKYPESYFLLREWGSNRDSLVNFLEQVHMGVKGVVLNEQGRPQGGVEIITWGPGGDRRGRNVTTSRTGEYWRMLLPGRSGNNTYTVQAVWDDCEPGGSGRVFASLKHRVIVSYKNKLRDQNMFLRQVGYCGIPEVPRNSPSVLQQLGVRQPTKRAEEKLPEDVINLVFDQYEEDDENISSAVDEDLEYDVYTNYYEYGDQDEQFA